MNVILILKFPEPEQFQAHGTSVLEVVWVAVFYFVGIWFWDGTLNPGAHASVAMIINRML